MGFRDLGCRLAAAAVLSAAVPAARAAERAHELRFEPVSTAFETMGAVTLFVAGFTAPIGHDPCRWCDAPGFDVSVRDALLAGHPEVAAGFSDGLAWGAVPLGAALVMTLPPLLGDPADRMDALENLVAVADALALTLALTEFTKRGAARERPGVHFGSGADISAGERNLSFWSSHTAVTFCLAASATTVSFLRGYDQAPWVAAGGGALAATAGLLRIAADRHWATDVLVGMAVGTGIGIGLPLLLHPRAGSAGRSAGVPWRFVALPAPDGTGASLGVAGRW